MILEIAAAIVLAVLILNFLPELLALGVVLIAFVAAIVGVVVVYVISQDLVEQEIVALSLAVLFTGYLSYLAVADLIDDGKHLDAHLFGLMCALAVLG